MNSELFNSRRRPYEFVFFAVAVLSLLAFALQDKYSFHPPLTPDYTDRVHRSLDSIAQIHGIDRDTTVTAAQLTTDEELLKVLVDSLGVLETRHYLNAHTLQEARYDVSVNPHGGSSSFNFSLSNNSRASGNESRPDESTLFRVSFDTDGRIVAVSSRIDSLPLLSAADTVAVSDSARVLGILLSLVPPHYKPAGMNWKTERYDPNGRTVYMAVLDSTALWTKRLRLTAVRHEARTNVWTTGWSEVVSANRKPKDHHSSFYWGLREVMNNTFLIIVFLLIIVLTGAFVSRLRKKAVSITFCITSSVIVAVYFFISSFIFIELPLIASIIILFTYSIVAFLLLGMPLAGIFSLIRERYAARFYTLIKLKREPWNSMFVGRSILRGLGAALIAMAITYATFLTADKGGWLSVFDELFFDSGLYFLSIQPSYGHIISMLFVTLIKVLLITIAPALTARIPSARLRCYLSVAGAVLVAFMFRMSQSGEIVDALLIGGLCNGLIGIAVFYTADILGVFVFSFVSSAITMLPVFSTHPALSVFVIALCVVLLLVGLKAYTSPAETVHEEEYKPLFVYQLEEEKRILQELAAAQSVQKRLLPTVLPKIDNVRVAASCIPALEVGGDYYDFFRLDDHRLGVLIGDVSGKGMSAAFYITLAKGVIVSQIHQAGTPSEVLKRVNSLVYGVLERGKFISLIYGILDTSTREFIYANAGHNPPLLRRAGGQKNHTDFIHTKGMAIGLDNGRIFDVVTGNHTLILQEGDILMLYTDGVTEAMDYNGNEYGEDRMRVVVDESSSGADNVVSSLVGAVMKFIGKAKQHDDITVVAVELVSPAAYQELSA